MIKLKCGVQTYLWGKFGDSSMVAKLAVEEPDEDVPYAELWMGTHISCPSYVEGTEMKLVDYIGSSLPFLFKVLSVRTALSIQAHPDKSLAQELHATRPLVYKDPNHKPEMAVALTPFEAMVGFRDFDQVVKNLETTVELKDLIGHDLVNEFIASNKKDGIIFKKIFTALMGSSKQRVEHHVSSMVNRLKLLESKSQLDNLVIRLSEQYPGDVGVFAPYLLNYVILQPGECIFLGPNLPHAYISGDCVECMANSDNVVRAGLTPKFIDTETLCNMLIYKGGDPSMLHPVSIDEHSVLYSPPFNEFQLSKTILNSRDRYKLPSRGQSSIMLVFKGDAVLSQLDETLPIASGNVVYIPPNLDIHCLANTELILYTCFSKP